MEWRNGIVRIVDAEGRTIGTGFVVATGEDVDPLVVTCAHVVGYAGAAPGQGVNVRFHPTGEERTVYVIPEWWRDSKAEDVDFLRVEGDLPEDVVPLPLGTSEHSRGHRFASRGYRKAEVFQDALDAAGDILGYTAYQDQRVLQLDSGHIDKGMSGAPVWDVQARRVVGMINAFWESKSPRDAGLSLAIPTETLRAVCHGLTLSDLCPYRGLAAFAEAHAEFFFGRERDVTRLLNRLRTLPRFLVVLGPSGSGKSSLVQAGLIPRLRQGEVPGSDRWHILLVDRPGTNPLQRLEEAGLPDARTDLAASVQTWLSMHTEVERLLIILDQFEEALVGEAEGRAFLKQVAALIETGLPVTVVLVQRDDFYSRLVATSPPGLQELLEAGLANVSARMTEEDLQSAVQRPAEMVGLRFETGLVERIVADAQDAWMADAERPARATILPLLEFALTQLWERRQEGMLAHEAYAQLGGVTGALTRWAHAAYGALSPEDRRLADRILTDLVDPGRPDENVAPTRRLRRLRDLCRDASECDRVHRAVRRLADYRLVVTAREGEAETVELIHDALIWGWEHLQRLVENNRDFMRWHEEIQEAVRRWKAGRGDLLSGRALTRALEWKKAREDDLSQDERAYIAASAGRARRNRYVLIGTTSLVIVLLSALALVAFLQRNQALEEAAARATAQAEALAEADMRATAQAQALVQRDRAEAARSTAEAEAHGRATAQAQAEARRKQAEEQRRLAQARQLAAQAQYMWRLPRSNTEKIIAPLLATESLKQVPSVEAFDVVQDVLFNWPRIHIIHHKRGVNEVAFSSDGRFLATASEDGTAALVETATSREITRIHHKAKVEKIAFSPDGRFLSTASADNTVALVETATGREITRIHHEDTVNEVTFSPDGRFLATASKDGTAVLVETDTGREITRIHHEDTVNEVTFSPDGRFLATASKDGTAALVEVATGREITRIHHEDTVNEVAFSPDGRFLATASWDGTAALVEVATGREITRIHHKDWVNDVAFSPDGHFLATASWDGTAALVEVATGREITRIHHKDWVNDVAFSPDGRFLATAGDDGSAALVETATGRDLTCIHHKASVNKVTFSPDGRFLATASKDGTAALVEVATGREITRIHHAKGMSDTIFSPNSRFLATASWDGTVTLVEVPTGREISRLHHKYFFYRTPLGSSFEISVYKVAFSFDSRFLATASRDGTSVLMETTSGRELVRIYHEDEIYDVAFGSDGRFLATASRDGTAVLVETATGRGITRIRHEDMVWDVALSPDGRFLATASADNTVALVETTSGHELIRINHKGDVNNVSFSPDGRFLATASQDGTAALVETATGREITRIHHEGPVWDVAFSPDGRLLATASQDGTAALVETATGREITRIHHEGPVWDAAFSPDGRFLATASQDGTAALVETATGREITRIHHEGPVDVVFSPDGRFLATASADNTVALVETTSGHELIRINHKGDVNNVSFSPDGRFLATASQDGTAALVETATGREITRIHHEAWVNEVTFSPDGRLLATASQDGTAALVETATGREITRIHHEGDVNEVAFSPDGRFLATASQDGTAALVDLSLGQEIARVRYEGPVHDIIFSPDSRYLVTAGGKDVYLLPLNQKELFQKVCERLLRNLTHAEWNRYIGLDEPYRPTCPNLPVPEK